MIPRHQLAVAPRITPTSLFGAAVALLGPRGKDLRVLASELRQRYSASECVLTDSGTSALVLALRHMLPEDGIIALPGYGCVDITSAVRFAGIRVRLYDVDPDTMSPDLDSLKRVLERGVQAVLVAHYYGYPADVAAVRALTSSFGVPILEDAAQAAGGSVEGMLLGSLGDASILSFGRGKGLFGGRGGALLVRSLSDAPTLDLSLGSRRGVAEWCGAAAQWALGRPELYALPASIPALRLGEMVYRPAREPRTLSTAAASLVRASLEAEAHERDLRMRKAAVYAALAHDAKQLTPIRPIEGAEPGYLRFAVIDRSGLRRPAARLGIMSGYPRTLGEQTELTPQLMPRGTAIPGAEQLCRSVFTLPTHIRVDRTDLMNLQRWIYHAGTACADLPSEHNAVPTEEALCRSSTL